MFVESPQTVDLLIERAAAAKLLWRESVGLTPLAVGRRGPCGARVSDRLSL
jgi:hypothetical protein